MVGGLGDGRSGGGGTRRWLPVLAPLVVSAVAQLELFQKVEGFWGVAADIVAPVWTLSIVVAATRLRGAVRSTDVDHVPLTPVGVVTADRRWVVRTTWGATGGGVLLCVFAWTREWSRFGPWPDAVLYGALVAATLGLLVVPLWWLRSPLLEAVDRTVSNAPAARSVDAYLFERPDPRWPVTLAMAAVTLLVGLAVLGRFNDMLGGMHAPGVEGVGIGALAEIGNLDLSTKTGVITDTVAVWKEFGAEAGPDFPSARAIVAAHTLIDTLLVVPSYVVGAVVLLLWVRRRRRNGASDSGEDDEEAARVRRASDLLTLFGLAVVAGLAVVGLVENFFTWYVVERSWTGGAVTELNARILWLATLAKTVAMGMLAVTALLVVAMRRPAWAVLRTAITVRAQLFVVLGTAVALNLPRQMSDVVRRWTAAECLIAVGLASVLAMLLSRFARAALRSQRATHEAIERGEAITPARLTLRRLGERPLRSVVVASLVAAAAVQVILDVATPLRVGRGLLIPAGVVAVLWALGVPLPSFPMRRDTAPTPEGVENALPGLIGGSVFVLLGIAVIRAAVGHLLAAGAEEWWLLLSLVPIGIGAWRVHRRGYRAIGGIELAGVAVIAALGAVLIGRGDPQLNPTSLVVVGVVITYGAFPFHYSHRSAALVSRLVAGTALYRVGFHPVIMVGVLATVLVVAATIWMPIEVAGYLGAIAVALLAGILVAYAGHWAVRFAERTAPPKFLAAFGIARTPMFGLLIVWYLLAPLLSSDGAYDIEVVAGGDHPVAGIGIEDVWERWAEANGVADPGPIRPGEERRAVPLLLVSSSGGGARAAVWTGFVTDCVFAARPGDDGIPCAERRPGSEARRSIAAMSGVSGGALGLASFAVSRDAAVERPELVGSDAWVEEVLGDDYLAAPLAWYLFVDIPRELLGFSPSVRDRGEILERAWEETWDRAGMPAGPDTGLYELWLEHPDLPVLVFSGTSVADACRFNASVLDLAVPDETGNCRSLAPFDGPVAVSDAVFPATHDLADFLCPGDDVRLSTAVNLSARYPFIAPSGRVPSREGCGLAEDRAVHVVDGGYLEGSGAGTLLDLWWALEPFVERHNASADTCIVPFAIHIDNGYETLASAGGSAPTEVAVPVIAYWGAQTGRLATARAALALTFDRPLTVAGEPLEIVGGDDRSVTSRFARVTTWAHPGVQAPLGWSLSQASIDDLRAQLHNDQNTAQLLEIASWLDGSLRCGS